MYTRILIPVDGSATSERGLHEGLRIAKAMKSTIVLLNVVDDFSLPAQMAATLDFDAHRQALARAGEALLERGARAAGEAGVAVDRVLRDVKGTPVADVILEEAKRRRCELIVMGTHGRRGLARVALGSDAELVLRHADVPVLLVRQAEG